MQFGQDHWSIESLGWDIEQSAECVSLVSPKGVGALQISCYRKGQGLVNERDIGTFREEALRASGVEPTPGTFGDFSGLTVTYEVN